MNEEKVEVAEEQKQQAVEVAEDQSPVQAPKNVKVPTLYVRNLNDKVKLEGKYLLNQHSINTYLLLLDYYRDESQPVHVVLNLWRGDSGENAGNNATQRPGFCRL